MIKKLLPLVALASVASLAYAAPSLACTYAIDTEAEKRRLARVVQASLDIGDEIGASVEVHHFDFYESKPTPMCPEELTYTAIVELTHPTEDCFELVEVTHVEPWGDAGDAADHFIVDALTTFGCFTQN